MRVSVRLLIVAAFFGAAWYVYHIMPVMPTDAVPLEDGTDGASNVAHFGKSLGYLITVFVLVLMGAGVAAASLLPALGEWAGSIFNPSTPPEKTPYSEAMAKYVQGDYEGAIEKYHALLEQDPLDTRALTEIARIYSDKLENPAAAAQFLESALESDRPLEQTAALVMKLSDIYAINMEDPGRAMFVLNQLIQNAPESTQASVASRRLREIELSQYQLPTQHHPAPTEEA